MPVKWYGDRYGAPVLKKVPKALGSNNLENLTDAELRQNDIAGEEAGGERPLTADILGEPGGNTLT
jgi:hypothetical protein